MTVILKLRSFPLLTSMKELEGKLHWLLATVVVPPAGLQAEASSLASQSLLAA